ncbi:MAG: transcription-repair coupling factor [Gemmatimonadota bacterium]
MSLILDALSSCSQVSALSRALPRPGESLTVGGLFGAAPAALAAALHRRLPERVLVVVASSPQAAAALEADFESLLGEQAPVHLYPQKEALPYEESEPHLEVGALRVEALDRLLTGRARILVTTPRALQERVPVPEDLALLRLTVRRGDVTTPADLARGLEERGFDRVSLVEEVGQFAVRGGIVDVFSVGAADPVRIEFWGDEVVSLRRFEILDQRSVGGVEEVHILPVDFRSASDASATLSRSLLELLPGDALFALAQEVSLPREAERTWQRVQALFDDLVDSGATPPEPDTLFLTPREVAERARRFPTLRLHEADAGDVVLPLRPPPVIERDMGRLQDYLREGAARGVRTLLLCDNDGQLHRLEEILGGPGKIPPGTSLGIGSLSGGFEVPCAEPELRVLNDHEIFRRSRRLRRSRRFRGAVALESLAQLSPGDYVVHMDHGVGIFRGMERIRAGGQEMEALAIEYAGGEVLRLPVYRLDLIERWVGESDDAKPPHLHRIGGRRWKNVRRKTERYVEELTTRLLELYARREAARGFAFSPDTRWQKEMESSFLYDNTPDQRAAAEAVKRDMESPRPMDRLVCGDVGYGKTEVAVRAAFKAVQDGKQVAFLAPTTILVEQHRHTLETRLADYPVRVGALSRFRSPAEQRRLLARLASGEVDIVVGTHRLLSEDVVFKDLGLLVVDEEQRFGVKHKERLKEMRASVDVLTLSATPIPRTLYLSLAGIRDLSLIRTPPRDRMPIFTHVLPWNDQILMDALHRELDRGGQTFFVHNRVETIYTVAEEIRALVPEARVEVAHGQMDSRALDEAVHEFVEGNVDVLVCTSIIENGMDVSNANTLIVDRPDRFGLSQLYQIRGRVGRSDRRAYCYLLVPENLSLEAEKRLRVLEHYTELGSGYSVALRDLELRGAGNLLGADQSGFAQQVGLDTYMRLLEKTVSRIRNPEQVPEYPNPDVSLPGPAYLPEGYIADPGQKLHLYRRLSRAETRREIEALREEVLDRFGALPKEVERLLDATLLRILGRRVGAERILVGRESARLSFRGGTSPRLTALQEPMRERQVEVEIRRLDPLSMVLHPVGPASLAEALVEALTALGAEGSGSEAAA